VRSSLTQMQRITSIGLLAAALWTPGADSQDKSLAQQIFETMIQLPGYNAAYRAAHAKGIVCQGTFTPSKDAASLSKAAHFQGGSIPIIATGVNDPHFPGVSMEPPADMQEIEFHPIDSGHFALEDHCEEIGSLTRGFLERVMRA